LRLRPRLRVLFSSGYSESPAVLRNPSDPDIQLLKKPFRRQDLAQAVRAALGKQ
jgi:FixJ family two-component response regulator